MIKLTDILNESTPNQVIKDLDKAKNDLLKKVNVLIAKKKKLYSDVDIESPMSADEKKLNKDIADLFSQINKLVLQKRSVKKESVNEGNIITKLNKVKSKLSPISSLLIQPIIDDKGIIEDLNNTGMFVTIEDITVEDHPKHGNIVKLIYRLYNKKFESGGYQTIVKFYGDIDEIITNMNYLIFDVVYLRKKKFEDIKIDFRTNNKVAKKWRYENRFNESVNEGKVHFEKKLKNGNIFQVVDRDTKGMRGKQDKFQIQIVDKRGKLVKDIGSHPSLQGAKGFVNKFELNERYRPNLDSKGWEAAQKVIRQLQSSVFRKLDDDELLEFRKAIADAFNLDGILKEQADHASPMVIKKYKL